MVEGKQGRLLDPQAVVVNQGKERTVTGRGDYGEQALDLLLGEVAGEGGFPKGRMFVT